MTISLWSRLFLLLALLGSPVVWSGTQSRDDLLVVVDTQAQRLDVLNGDKVVFSADGIAIGRGGAGAERRRGDAKTPLGHFQITEIKPSKTFGTFLLLDFPRRGHVEAALRSGLISEAERNRLIRAIERGQPPPQDSPLGGQIGIHGVGTGNPRLHALTNWTSGCVALTNSQLSQLLRLVSVGTEVVIR